MPYRTRDASVIRQVAYFGLKWKPFPFSSWNIVPSAAVIIIFSYFWRNKTSPLAQGLIISSNSIFVQIIYTYRVSPKINPLLGQRKRKMSVKRILSKNDFYRYGSKINFALQLRCSLHSKLQRTATQKLILEPYLVKWLNCDPNFDRCE